MTNPIEARAGDAPTPSVADATIPAGSELVKRLRKMVDDVEFSHTVSSEMMGLMLEAATTIQRLESRLETLEAEKAKMRECAKEIIAWAYAKCPCSDDTPDPCPLCDASVANGTCKAADETISAKTLIALRALATTEDK